MSNVREVLRNDVSSSLMVDQIRIHERVIEVVR